MTTDDGKAAADAVAAAAKKLVGLLVQAPAAVASSPIATPATAAPPPPVVTDFAWAKAQMQAGLKVTRPSWGDKTVFLGSSGNELMRLPQGFPTGGLVVPWLYAPGDVDATDWEIAT